MLPNYLILDPRVDQLPPAELRALQGERLRHMVHYVFARAPFWRRKFDAIGLKPEDIRGIEDLSKIPFCTKEELQQDQLEHPPFGSYVCTAPSQWQHYAATSGTTGRPLRRVLSARDWGYILDRFRRKPGLKPGDVAMILGPTDGLLGPTVAIESVRCLGALPIQASMHDTETKVRMIAELRPAFITGTASYLLRILEVADQLGIDLAQAGVRVVSSVGEPGAAIEGTRKRLQDGFGGATISDGYGLTELFPLGGRCPGNDALHIVPDMAITEVVDPVTGAPLPPGELGEVVFSNIVNDTQPLLRFRSRDLSRLAREAVCPACGFAGARLEGSIVGRVDDMIWYHGVNVFPTAIEQVLGGFAELGSEYRIEIDGDEALPKMTIRVETRAGLAPAATAELAQRLAVALLGAIKVNAAIELLPPGELPRSDGRRKTRRVVDHRRVRR